MQQLKLCQRALVLDDHSQSKTSEGESLVTDLEWTVLWWDEIVAEMHLISYHSKGPVSQSRFENENSDSASSGRLLMADPPCFPVAPVINTAFIIAEFGA